MLSNPLPISYCTVRATRLTFKVPTSWSQYIYILQVCLIKQRLFRHTSLTIRSLRPQERVCCILGTETLNTIIIHFSLVRPSYGSCR